VTPDRPTARYFAAAGLVGGAAASWLFWSMENPDATHALSRGTALRVGSTGSLVVFPLVAAALGAAWASVLEAKFGFFYDLLHRSPHANELMDSKRLCADVFAAGDAAYLGILTKAVADAVRRGELAPRRHGLAPEDVAQMLMAGANGLTVEPTESLSNEEHRRRLGALVRVVADGLRAR